MDRHKLSRKIEKVFLNARSFKNQTSVYLALENMPFLLYKGKRKWLFNVKVNVSPNIRKTMWKIKIAFK